MTQTELNYASAAKQVQRISRHCDWVISLMSQSFALRQRTEMALLKRSLKKKSFGYQTNAEPQLRRCLSMIRTMSSERHRIFLRALGVFDILRDCRKILDAASKRNDLTESYKITRMFEIRTLEVVKRAKELAALLKT